MEIDHQFVGSTGSTLIAVGFSFVTTDEFGRSTEERGTLYFVRHDRLAIRKVQCTKEGRIR